MTPENLELLKDSAEFYYLQKVLIFYLVGFLIFSLAIRCTMILMDYSKDFKKYPNSYFDLNTAIHFLRIAIAALIVLFIILSLKYIELITLYKSGFFVENYIQQHMQGCS